MTDEQKQNEWHLDRKVTLSLILALLANAGATVWWASKLDSRVTAVEQRQEQVVDVPERITRVETQVLTLERYLQRIEDKLDRVIETKASR
jgi:hypothetical protein